MYKHWYSRRNFLMSLGCGVTMATLDPVNVPGGGTTTSLSSLPPPLSKFGKRKAGCIPMLKETPHVFCGLLFVLFFYLLPVKAQPPQPTLTANFSVCSNTWASAALTWTHDSQFSYVACTPIRGGSETNSITVVKLDRTSGALLFSRNFLRDTFYYAKGIAVDEAHNVYVLYGDNIIARVSPDGTVVDEIWSSSVLVAGTIVRAPNGSGLYVVGTADGDAAFQFIEWAGFQDTVKKIGGSGNDIAVGLSFTATANIILIGRTDSADFPVTHGGQVPGGGNGFVTEVTPQGLLVHSKLLGGTAEDSSQFVTRDVQGNTLVCTDTSSADAVTFYPLQNANAGNSDILLTKLSQTFETIFSTYLGGSGNESCGGIATDDLLNVYVTGRTQSADFPSYRSAQVYAGNWQAFLTKISGTGQSFIFSGVRSGGSNLFFTGYQPLVDSDGSLLYLNKSHSYLGGGDSNGAVVLRFAPNEAPVSNSGVDQVIPTLEAPVAVSLSGVGSFDPDGDPLTFEWRDAASTLVSSSNVLISNLGFGTHEFILHARDSSGEVDSDRVLVNIVPMFFNIVPMYDAAKPINRKVKSIELPFQIGNSIGVNLSSAARSLAGAGIARRGGPILLMTPIAFAFDSKLKAAGAPAGGGYRATLGTPNLPPGEYDLLFTVGINPLLHRLPFVLK